MKIDVVSKLFQNRKLLNQNFNVTCCRNEEITCEIDDFCPQGEKNHSTVLPEVFWNTENTFRFVFFWYELIYQFHHPSSGFTTPQKLRCSVFLIFFSLVISDRSWHSQFLNYCVTISTFTINSQINLKNYLQTLSKLQNNQNFLMISFSKASNSTKLNVQLSSFLWTSFQPQIFNISLTVFN